MYFKHLFRVFHRSPREGDRKDIPMPSVQAPQQPAAPAPQPSTGPAPAPAPAQREDLSEHLSTLIDAMRELAESQKSLVETVKKSSATDVAPAAPPSKEPAAPVPPVDIGGDPGGGARPGAVVDYSRLSPLQQITLGLRGAGTKGISAGAD